MVGGGEKKRHSESPFFSIFFRPLGCSLPLHTGLRSHYLPLISVADSSGAVRDCRGQGEEGGGGGRRNEAYSCESEHTQHQPAQIEAEILQDFR